MTLDQPFQPYMPLGEHSFQPSALPFDPSPPPTSASTRPISFPPLEPALQPLRWLWPGHIPQGKLTLLDGSPNCGTTLFALTLATHVSTGRPWPDGTPCPQGTVLLLSPHDSFRDTILPRLQAAGADDGRILPFSHMSDTTSTDPHARRRFSLTQDLAFLETLIRDTNIVLLILDPYTAFPGWQRALPDLIELTARTRCAIVLTRSLARVPVDLLHPRCPNSAVLTAARSHLLLVPDPSDERHYLLLTPKHPLCAAPAPLAYTITPTAENVPIVAWLPAPDPAHLRRLATGPIRSPQRQAILQFLHECPKPCHIKDILAATTYDYEAGRKMLLRMKLAGELVSPTSGLYTTADHPCLGTRTTDSQPASTASPVPGPNVPVSNVPDQVNELSTPTEQNHSTSVGPDLSWPSPQRSAAERVSILRPPAGLDDHQTDILNRRIVAEETLVDLRAHLAASGYPISTIPMSHVPCPNSNNSHDSPSTERNNDKGIGAQSFIPGG